MTLLSISSKKLVQIVFSILLNKFTSMMLSTSFGRSTFQKIIDNVMNRNLEVRHQSKVLKLSAPNPINHFRALSFSTKEPETLDWIDSIPDGAVFWDVGANVGLYSVYAAKQNCQVISFEPSVFNLELLARNININDLGNRICILPLALNSHSGPNLFRMTTTEWGGALASFEHSIDQNGAPLKSLFEYLILGVSIDDAVEMLRIPCPDYLKIDVDGIEHLVLRGGKTVLASVKSVLIEINDGFTEQADEAALHLREAGLRLLKKCDNGVPNQFNQIWLR